jgi:hypothetical protein
VGIREKAKDEACKRESDLKKTSRRSRNTFKDKLRK